MTTTAIVAAHPKPTSRSFAASILLGESIPGVEHNHGVDLVDRIPGVLSWAPALLSGLLGPFVGRFHFVTGYRGHGAARLREV